jgi:hypothetical protein
MMMMMITAFSIRFMISSDVVGFGPKLQARSKTYDWLYYSISSSILLDKLILSQKKLCNW